MRIYARLLYTGTAVLILAGSPFAGSWALFGSFATLGSTAGPTGGVRCSLNSDICIDVGAGPMKDARFRDRGQTAPWGRAEWK